MESGLEARHTYDHPYLTPPSADRKDLGSFYPMMAHGAHIPVVESRTPLWDSTGELPVVTGLRVDEKEMLLTTVVAATPDLREPVPAASLWPLIAAMAVGVLFVSSIFSPWAVVFGTIPTAIALAAWFWPKELKRHPEPVIT